MILTKSYEKFGALVTCPIFRQVAFYLLAGVAFVIPLTFNQYS